MASPETDNLIKEDEKVVLKMGDKIQVVTVKLKKKYQLGKLWFNLEGAMGHPYGSCFEAKGNKLIKVTMDVDGDTEINTEGVKDNRNLFDSNDNQKLSRDDIEEMKQKGLNKMDIVDQLVENSATFKEKTEFAQQKYIKKKKKKYENKLIIHRPTIRLISEMYFNKGPTRICCLRMDSLSQILNQANVQARSRILLVDGCNGIVLAALMEKMAGFGTIVDFYVQDSMSRPAVGNFDFPDQVANMVKQFPLSRVAELSCWASKRPESAPQQQSAPENMETKPEEEGSIEGEPVTKRRKLEETSEDISAKEEANKDATDESQETKTEKEENKTEEDDTSELTSDPRAHKRDEQSKRREKRLAEVEETKKMLDMGEFDGLIVAARHQPAPLVLSLIELLAPSRPVVVFSAQLEPLEDCYMRLRDRGGVVAMKVTETWQRNYQILPNRTHPEILMNNCSGYLLTATTTTCDAKSDKL